MDNSWSVRRIYWVGQEFHSGFLVQCYGKTQRNFLTNPIQLPGLPWWLSSKESVCQCRRHRFNSRVEKIPCRRKQQGRTRWWRSRQKWIISLSIDTSRIHLQRQKILQNTSREQAGAPAHWKRTYRARKIQWDEGSRGRRGEWAGLDLHLEGGELKQGSDPHIGAIVQDRGKAFEAETDCSSWSVAVWME